MPAIARWCFILHYNCARITGACMIERHMAKNNRRPWLYTFERQMLTACPTESERRTEFMHFYTSQLCLHSRDVYFTTKNRFYCSPRFECFTSSILLAKMFISICKLTPTVLLALTVSCFLHSSLRLFHYYRSAHFDCFTATVHLAVNKANAIEWKMTSTVRRT